MNTVRLCFTATVTCLAVAISWSATDAMVCCDSQYGECRDITSHYAQNHKIRYRSIIDRPIYQYESTGLVYSKLETIGNGTCDEDEEYEYEMTSAWPVPLCSIVDNWGDNTIYLVQLIERLRVGFPAAAAGAVMVGYYSQPAYCNDKQVLLRLDVPKIDVPAVEVRRLFEGVPSAVKLPEDYCFDRTDSGGIEAQVCRPREQYCGQDGYTCVNKCCSIKQIFFYNDDGLNCGYNLDWPTPINMPVYETDADGRPVRLSNRTKSSNIIFNPQRSNMEILKKELFMLTTDGSLYRTDKKQLVMDTRYCVEYVGTQWSKQTFHAFIWDDETESPAVAEDKRGSWMYLISQASYVTSAVCLALTLLVYAKLSYLRNVHGYYVMCYMTCELVWFVCEIINKFMIFDNILLFNTPFGILFKYFNLFAMLTTCCWLNIICFDIYWMLRYNNSINRNTSTSVRTILYHIYCWGFSSFCVSTGYLFQHSNNKTLLQISPYVGDFLCYFYDCTYLRNIIFLIMCMSVMQTANLILFLLTAMHCSRIKSEINKFNPTDSKTESFLDYKKKFVMNIKLFLIMGMPRSSEIIPFFFQKETIMWDIFATTGSLQGVFVFIIFVAKHKIIMDLRKNFKRSMDHSEQTPLNTISGSS